jgi:transposase
VKKARVEHRYAIAGREVTPEPGESEVIFCMDEFGPLNLQPRPGRQRAAVSGKGKEPGRQPRPRMRATYHRTEGVRQLLAAYELGENKLFRRIKPRKTRTRFLEFCRYLRTLYPPQVRIAIICDSYSPHLTTARDTRVGDWAGANNVVIAYTPTNCSWLNRIEAQFTTALLRARRDRSRQPPRAGQHDPPLHHLAQQPRLRPAAPPHRHPGKRSLTRH